MGKECSGLITTKMKQEKYGEMPKTFNELEKLRHPLIEMPFICSQRLVILFVVLVAQRDNHLGRSVQSCSKWSNISTCPEEIITDTMVSASWTQVICRGLDSVFNILIFNHFKMKKITLIFKVCVLLLVINTELTIYYWTETYVF